MIARAVGEDVVLRDGSTLRLRRTTAADEQPLVDFFGRLSAESLHLRFQGAVRSDSHLVAPFLGGDGRESLSLVGELVDQHGSTRIVAIGTYMRLRDPLRAE